MKFHNILRTSAILFGVLTIFSSCNDFLTIYPTDKTIAEDFWKTKSDVKEMVNGVYKSMIASGIQEREIIWGGFRSDELAKYSNYSSSSLDNISAVNLLPTNGYNTWGAFYSVINSCNIVLKHAPGVMDLDPEYTEGDYQETRAQMLAVRALCYFYLVRTFRDVPYTTHAYEDDDSVMTIPQTTPDSVLNYCISDLKDAEQHIMKSGAYGDWRDVGYMTRDAVDALLSDIYLWRASMTHSTADYEQSIAYADKVISSKDTYYRANYSDNVNISNNSDIYHLYDGSEAFQRIFVRGNSLESILELQYDGTNNSNTSLENYYYKSASGSSTSILMASQIFNAIGTDVNTIQGTKAYGNTKDYRYWNNVYGVNNEEATQLSIRKFVSNSNSVVSTSSTVGETKDNSRAYDYYQQNWIIYRLTDIMLMKAEAEVQIATSDSDEMALRKAFNLVQVVNKRSLSDDSKDTLQYSDYNTKEGMELLVLAERERELCFEGKRWYDLVRYCYRHMSGVNIDAKMADQTTWPSLYSPMLKLIVRKYVSGGDAVSFKMKSEPYLYFPISESEIKVNGLLQQNPVYVQTESTSKN